MFSQTKKHYYFIKEQFEWFKLLKELSNIISAKRCWILLYPEGIMAWRVDIKETLSGNQIEFLNQEERP
jgi:hypothetical protein